MAPGSRKRLKLSPSGADSQSTPTSNDKQDSSTDAVKERSTLRKRGSGLNLYLGSLSSVSLVSSKAAPVTEVACESVASSNTISSSISLHDFPKQHRSSSIQLTRKAGTSSRSLPADATTTRINVASDGSASTPVVDSPQGAAIPTSQSSNKEKSEENITGAAGETVREGEQSAEVAAPPSAPDTAGGGSGDIAAPENQTAGWFSWFYSYIPSVSGTSDPTGTDSPELEAGPPTDEQTLGKADAQPVDRLPEEQSEVNEDIEQTPQPQKLSWFQMWREGGSSLPSRAAEEPKKEEPAATDACPQVADTECPSDRPAGELGQADITAEPPARNVKSSGWSFWSRDTSKDLTNGKSEDVKTVEASIAQDASKPLNQDPDANRQVEITQKGSVKAKKQKDSVEAAAAEGLSGPPLTAPKATEPTASKQLQKVLPNQVLPHFRDTFALQGAPSLLQTIGRFLHYTKEPERKHVYVVKDPHHIKKALAIGVHGYFPAPFIRSVLGQPTGTSVKFCTMAASAVKKYAESRGYECEVEKIALEGEGRIAERVDLLWKLLLNWMEEIRKADFVLFACHSQGVPVTIMLVAKLIAFGCLDTVKVGVCAMAGVNLGPFPDYKSRWISGSAGELFEFALPHSRVSRDYEDSLRRALDFGVRISYIGSIDDQLVSLESSLFSPISHPYIYRAVFVDGRVHAPSFLSHLVGFTLKLRNLGVPDHGLIKELSSPLAGSLYTGEGHSRLYDDEAVYHLAIEFALETSNVGGATLEIKRPTQPYTPNPYILPFAMRGLLEEEYVRRELHQEMIELLRQFDDWKPASKVLKDVKFRLEGIRSKL